ncbi:helix-turn-helix domain-containing protein [Bacillus cereus group sp. IBL03679]|uniref:helix-turn-helix domain-containing protein n=1 Tax=Bacillus cereus group sp. IBL03679 TaxID=3240095 RepID=UPI003D2F8B04
MSQEKLAEITGLHRTYISEVERGNRNISLINISKIATALDINVSDLFIYINL